MRVHHLYHVFNVVDLTSPQARYDIPRQDPRLGGLAVLHHAGHQHTMLDRELILRHYLRIEIDSTYPDPRTHDFAFFHQLLGYPHGGLYRDGESDPLDRMYVHICVLHELDVAHVDHAGHYLLYRCYDCIVKTCYMYHLAWKSEMRVEMLCIWHLL